MRLGFDTELFSLRSVILFCEHVVSRNANKRPNGIFFTLQQTSSQTSTSSNRTMASSKNSKGSKKGSATKDRKQKAKLQPLKRGPIARMAKKAGIKRISSDVYNMVRAREDAFLSEIVFQAMNNAQYQKHKTVSLANVEQALRTLNYDLVGAM